MVDDIYLMGGTAFERGNVTPVAEANFHNDPAAASRVIQDADAKMVGLDVTNGASPAPRPSIRTMTAAAGSVSSPTGSATRGSPGASARTSRRPRRRGRGGPYRPRRPHVRGVLLRGRHHRGPSHGAVVCDQYGVRDADPNTAVAVDMDLERFRSIFRSGIEGYATAVDPANG